MTTLEKAVQKHYTNFPTRPSSKLNKIEPKLIVTKNVNSVVVSRKMKMDHGRCLTKICSYI